MRVVLGEDLTLLRDGLVRLLAAYDMHVVAAVDNGPELVTAMVEHRPDVAVVDVRLPPTFTDEGLRAAIAARRRVPGLPVLVLSQHVEQLYARELMSGAVGGFGYLLKDRVSDVVRFVEAVRTVAGGGSVMDPEVVAQMLARHARDVSLARLTSREREVLALMAEGRSNAAIAQRMVVTEKAVSKHINSIFTKLDLHPAGDDNRRVLAVLTYLNALWSLRSAVSPLPGFTTLIRQHCCAADVKVARLRRRGHLAARDRGVLVLEIPRFPIPWGRRTPVLAADRDAQPAGLGRRMLVSCSRRRLTLPPFRHLAAEVAEELRAKRTNIRHFGGKVGVGRQRGRSTIVDRRGWSARLVGQAGRPGWAAGVGARAGGQGGRPGVGLGWAARVGGGGLGLLVFVGGGGPLKYARFVQERGAGPAVRFGHVREFPVSATIQGELWSSDPRGWAEAAEGRIRPLYERVLERLHLLPGTRLLDAGCGSGLFAELAARGGADVTGLDAAPGLVEYARRRRPAASYVVDDLERMPFGDGGFDVVTAFNSVLYAADPRRALAEIARVTAPSGRAVVTVGAGPEQAESAALIDPLAPHDEVPDRSTLDLTDADAARGALLDAGFASVATADIAFHVDFESVDDAVAAQLPAGPVAAAVRQSGRVAVEAALRSFFGPRSRADGTVRMGVVFRCYLAERAGDAPFTPA